MADSTPPPSSILSNMYRLYVQWSMENPESPQALTQKQINAAQKKFESEGLSSVYDSPSIDFSNIFAPANLPQVVRDEISKFPRFDSLFFYSKKVREECCIDGWDLQRAKFAGIAAHSECEGFYEDTIDCAVQVTLWTF